MTGNGRLEGNELGGVAIEQVEHVLGGADRPLDATQRVPRNEIVDPVVGHEEFISRAREALAQCRCLSRDIVRATGDRGLGVGDGERGQALKRGDDLELDEEQCIADLQLLDVLRQVARGHPEVDGLEAGEVVELLDASLHVVLGDPLASRDRLKVDLVDHRQVGLGSTSGNRQAECSLSIHYRDPEPPFEQDLRRGRPDVVHGIGCVASGEHIRDR